MSSPPAQMTNSPVMGEHGDGRVEGRNEPNPGGVMACQASKAGLGKTVVYFVQRSELLAGLEEHGTEEGETEAAKST